MGATPFDDQGRLDEDALRAHVQWLSSEGISVLPASASSGEGPLLSDEEVFRVWEIVVEEAAGRFPVVVANREFPTAAENIRFAREAESRGLDGIQLYPPTLGHVIAPTTDVLEAFYEDVLPHVRLPVLVSSNQATGFEVPLAVHERLLARHEHIFAFYKNHSDLMNCASAYARMAPRTTVLTGFVRLPMAFLLGATGELDHVQNLMPRTARALHDALHTGDLARASTAYARIVEAQAATTRFGQEEGLNRMPVYKGVLRALGRPGTWATRAPYRPLSDEQQSRLAAVVDRLGLAELEGLA
ncbi:dihydrodipicolinate synthase family protein [Nocardioides humi]|nr:dihydrodipicolinate synthase family protein [Nocardioides humi]